MNAVAPHLGFSQAIDLLEIETARVPQVDCPTVHRFAGGVYFRETSAPAGTLVTTKIATAHRTEAVPAARTRARPPMTAIGTVNRCRTPLRCGACACAMRILP